VLAMLADSTSALLCSIAKWRIAWRPAVPRRRPAHRAGRQRRRGTLLAWLPPKAHARKPARARRSVQHHLFVGHHRIAQGHRAKPQDAPRIRAAHRSPAAMTTIPA
jgi:hypothetical protein